MEFNFPTPVVHQTADFDTYPPLAFTGEGREEFLDWTGECPVCFRASGTLMIGSDYVNVCDEHGFAWCVGVQITDAWRGVTPEQRADALDRLARCKLILPEGRRLASASDGEKAAHTRLREALGAHDAAR